MKSLMTTTSWAVLLGAAILLGGHAATAADQTVSSLLDEGVELEDTDLLTITATGAIDVDDGNAVEVEDAPSIDNSGLLRSTEDSAIEGELEGTGIAVTITNRLGGEIVSEDGRGIQLEGEASGTVIIDNYGTIQTLTDDGHRALDLEDLEGAGTGADEVLRITLNNYATGIISSEGDEDMVRPGGKNTIMTVNNWGRITVLTNNDAVDFSDVGGLEGNLHNYAGGRIEGGKHAVTGDGIDVDVINDAGALLYGRNGSGINIDGFGATVTVTNRGTITGGYDAGADGGTGDGDAIDVDGKLILDNWGRVEGLGAGGINDDDGLENHAEGIAVGGGTINNYSTGVVIGLENGVLVDDSSQGDAPYAIQIDNAGLIEGTNGDAIRITGIQADTVINRKTGIIRGADAAVDLGGGNDRLVLYAGSTVEGSVTGGDGDDTLELAGTATDTAVLDLNPAAVETLEVSGGHWSLATASHYDHVVVEAAGSFLLNAQSALSGTGTLRAAGLLDAQGDASGYDAVLDGGTLDVAGLGIGTLSFKSFSAGGDAGTELTAGDSTLIVDINAAGESDFLDITGTLSLADTTGTGLRVYAADGVYNEGDSFHIASADMIEGEFATVTTNFAFLAATLDYEANDLYLDLSRNGVSFADVAETDNQQAVAEAAEADAELSQTIIGLTGDPTEAFDQLSGDTHADVAGAIAATAGQVEATVGNRVDAAFAALELQSAGPFGYAADGETAEAAAGYGIWGQGVVHYSDVDGDGNGAGFTAGTGGLFIGADRTLDADWIGGLFVGLSSTSADIAERDAEIDIVTGTLGAYAGGRINQLAVNLGGAMSAHGVTTSRDIVVGDLDETLTADYGALSLELFGELGYELELSNATTLKPFLGLGYFGYGSESFSETGSDAALSSDGTDYATGIVTLGLAGSHRFAMGDGALASLDGTIAWRHNTSDEAPTAEMSFGTGKSFTVAGAPIAQDVLQLEAGLSVDLDEALALGASYGGQFADGEQSHALEAHLAGKF